MSATAWDFSNLDPASIGMAGAGIAWGARPNITANPALLALSDTRAEVLVDFPQVGWQKNYQNGLQTALDAFQVAARRFESSQSTADQLALTDSIQTLTDNSRNASRFGGGRMAFPNLPVALAAYVTGSYHEILTAQPANEASRVSAVIVRKGVAIIDTGGIFSGTLRGEAGQSRTAIGIAPKLLSVRTYFGRSAATSADLDQIPARTHESGKINIDIGIVQELGFDWSAGLAVQNVVPFTAIASQADSIEFHSRPAARVGIARRMNKWIIAADSDVNANGGFDLKPRQRIVSVGGQYSANDWLKLRIGTFLDVAGKSKENSGVAGGFGIATEYLNTDFAAMLNKQDWTIAGRLGLTF